MIITIALSSLLIMLASLIGAISVWKNIGSVIERNLHYLVSFSAGVFIIITYEISHEAMDHGGLAWIVIGIIASLTIFKFLPDFHHHHDNESEHSHSKIDARRIIFSDAIHNFGDGVLLATSFMVSVGLGIATMISVFIHEIIQEISEFFVLKQAGLSIKKALIINFITSSTIIIGSLVGYYLLEKFEAIEGPLLGITAGSFLVVVLHDLIPHSIKSITNRLHVIKHIGWFVFGVIIMILVKTLLPDFH